VWTSFWAKWIASSFSIMLKTKLWLARRGINSDSAQKRLEAVQRIRVLNDPEAVGVLIEALRDTEAAVRAEVVAALGDLEDARVIKPLLDALRDRSEPVQRMAIQALKKRGDASVVETLVGVLMRGTPGVQYPAAQALRSFGWMPRTEEEQIQFYVACGDFNRVSMFGPETVSALTGALREGSPERRVAAAIALAEVGGEAVVRPLLEALKDGEAMVRSAAARSLARVSDSRAISALIRILKDRDANVRVATVAALGEFGDKSAVKALLELAGDPNWEVRATLAETLGRLADLAAVETIRTLAADPDQEVRQNAFEALGRLGDERALEKLMQGLLDEHMGVRQAAARALMMLDPYWDRSPQAKTFLPQLEAGLQHRHPAVQFAAVSLLQRLTGKTSLEMNTTRLAKSAGTSQEQLLGIFETLLRDPDDEVRLAAVEAVVRLETPTGIPVLQTALADKNRWVKQAADRGLLAITSGQ
jgi:HEAT repeat protein